MNNVVPINTPRCIVPNCGQRVQSSPNPQTPRLCSEHQLPTGHLTKLQITDDQTWRTLSEQEAILHFYDRPIARRRSQRMLSLVWSFPCLRRCPLGTWDAKKFGAWAREKCFSSGELHAARFVLSVWNPTTRWRFGKFDAMRALAVWDTSNRRAFLEWAKEPWWP